MRNLFFAGLAGSVMIITGLWVIIGAGFASDKPLAIGVRSTALVFGDGMPADDISGVNSGRDKKSAPESQTTEIQNTKPQKTEQQSNITQGINDQDTILSASEIPAKTPTDTKLVDIKPKDTGNGGSRPPPQRGVLPQGERRNILVTDIINGACFRDEKWRKYCLAGIYVPLPDPIGEDITPEPFAEEARALLYHYIFNRQIGLIITGEPNRWGTAYVMLSDLEEMQEPMQHELLSRGLAYLAASPAGLAAEIYSGFEAQQNAARQKRHKIWQSSRFEVLTAATAQRGIGQYRFIRGTVLSTAVTRDRVYLNFGPDYRTDFTITIEAPLYKAWRAEGFDVAAFEGRQVEVYGRLKSINGPSLALMDRQYLKIIGKTTDADGDGR